MDQQGDGLPAPGFFEVSGEYSRSLRSCLNYQVMDHLRDLFLESAMCAASLLGRSEVADRWTEASVLPEFTIFGLAGHLLRGIRTVEKYLDGPDPVGASINAAGYFDSIAITSDMSSSLNRDVRLRGEEEAKNGNQAVAIEAYAVTERLGARLATEAVDRRIQVLGGLVISLDEYLRTRLVELVLHTEDLALSVDLPDAAEIAPAAVTVAIDTLVNFACLRHGERAVLRALARRERDTVNALRVL